MQVPQDIRKMTIKIATLCVIVAIIVVITHFFFLRFEQTETELTPLPVTHSTKQGAGISGTEVGTGWSTNQKALLAVKEAARMALKGASQKEPDFAVILGSAGSDMTGILRSARDILGPKVKIFGGTSDSRAVITDKGFVEVSDRGYSLADMKGPKGLAMMTITSKDIIFGVGSANLADFNEPQEMSKTAVLRAIIDAGKTETDQPDVILLCASIGIEEEVLKGVEDIWDSPVPLVGGTVGGPDAEVLGKNKAYEKGACFAVIYTPLSVGWTYNGGFDVTTEHSGIVTKVQGQDIIEIDYKPALEVYNSWLDGKIEELHNRGEGSDVIRDLLTLHPLYRKYISPKGQDYFLFSHPWPKNNQLKSGIVSTSTKIKQGERVYLSQGTWETLVNRIGKLPLDAKNYGGISANTQPVLGIGFICGGVMGVIPKSERKKLPFLINYSNKNAPFIANFTWGEQGYFPDVGYKHGNLLCSFIVIGSGEKPK